MSSLNTVYSLQTINVGRHLSVMWWALGQLKGRKKCNELLTLPAATFISSLRPTYFPRPLHTLTPFKRIVYYPVEIIIHSLSSWGKFLSYFHLINKATTVTPYKERNSGFLFEMEQNTSSNASHRTVPNVVAVQNLEHTMTGSVDLDIWDRPTETWRVYNLFCPTFPSKRRVSLKVKKRASNGNWGQ